MIGWLVDAVALRLGVVVGVGDLGLKPQAIECRRSATLGSATCSCLTCFH